MDRSLDMVAAILGFVKAGGAYLPLDPAYPQIDWPSCSTIPIRLFY
jgi:non-ribosomal peptide synthetase component F